MSYVTDNLRPAEQLIFEAKVTYVGAIISLLFSWVFLFLPTLWLLLVVSKTELGITSKRVIVKTGVLSSNTKETTLDKIQNVTFRQSLLGRLFNYGTVVVQTGATYGREGLRAIKDPKQVRDVLLEQMETHRLA